MYYIKLFIRRLVYILENKFYDVNNRCIYVFFYIKVSKMLFCLYSIGKYLYG